MINTSDERKKVAQNANKRILEGFEVKRRAYPA
jgi:hypothetical protein